MGLPAMASLGELPPAGTTDGKRLAATGYLKAKTQGGMKFLPRKGQKKGKSRCVEHGDPGQKLQG